MIIMKKCLCLNVQSRNQIFKATPKASCEGLVLGVRGSAFVTSNSVAKKILSLHEKFEGGRGSPIRKMPKSILMLVIDCLL